MRCYDGKKGLWNLSEKIVSCLRIIAPHISSRLPFDLTLRRIDNDDAQKTQHFERTNANNKKKTNKLKYLNIFKRFKKHLQIIGECDYIYLHDANILDDMIKICFSPCLLFVLKGRSKKKNFGISLFDGKCLTPEPSGRVIER